MKMKSRRKYIQQRDKTRKSTYEMKNETADSRSFGHDLEAMKPCTMLASPGPRVQWSPHSQNSLGHSHSTEVADHAMRGSVYDLSSLLFAG